MYDVKPVTTAHATACGPACLKMLLAYYGHEADLDALIAECGVGVGGCTATDVVRVSRAHGVELTAFRMDAEDVLRQDRPAILWWRYSHFVVFCGLNDKGEPVIANPSSGRFGLPKATFLECYAGIALCRGVPDDMIPADYWGENSETPEYFDYDEEEET